MHIKISPKESVGMVELDPALVFFPVLDKNTAEGRDCHDVAMVMLNCVGRKKKDVRLARVLTTLDVYLLVRLPYGV
ncbi:UNVERIFIED_CONTAM: hypothetical protein FKN15_056853 [Acipenser sinensis]